VHKDLSPFYKSRATILDRPAWRDDPFTFELHAAGEILILQIIGVFSPHAFIKHHKSKKNSKSNGTAHPRDPNVLEEIYDEIRLPDMHSTDIQKRFFINDTHDLEV
jgi:hypothetical protein